MSSELNTPKVYFDRSFNLDAARLLPGEYFATNNEMLLITTLGSCVSACIRDTRTGIGGMNHFMLPESANESSGWGPSSTRYGAYAMEMLINNLLKLGARRENLEAKLFGGGAVIRQMQTMNVGERNAKFGVEYLQTEGIPITAQDLLDIYPRRVAFFPKTGKVLVKKLQLTQSEEIISREKTYQSSLQTETVSGDIELF